MEITLEEIRIISGREKFGMQIIEKDYLVTRLLFLLKDIEGIYFKDGTALNKIFLNHSRLSEDIDFTLTRDIKETKEKIREVLDNSSCFLEISEGKNVDGFLRMIVKYKSELGESEIFIDLNKIAGQRLPFEKV